MLRRGSGYKFDLDQAIAIAWSKLFASQCILDFLPGERL